MFGILDIIIPSYANKTFDILKYNFKLFSILYSRSKNSRYTTYDRTLENQKGLSCLSATGVTIPDPVFTESYECMTILFQRPTGRVWRLSFISNTYFACSPDGGSNDPESVGSGSWNRPLASYRSESWTTVPTSFH